MGGPMIRYLCVEVFENKGVMNKEDTKNGIIPGGNIGENLGKQSENNSSLKVETTL